MPVLTIENLVKVYRKGSSEVRALNGVNLEIGKGEFLAVVGPSGSGKTTLLNIVGCLDLPTSGTVSYEGTHLRSMKEDQLADYRRDRISFIFQSYNLIPVLTVRENVELPLVIERTVKPAERRRRALEIIDAVGLADKADKFPRELSGGQEQRVAIARALVKEPLVVLADEPTANLDSRTAEEIIGIMERINAERGATFIFSTHDSLVQRHARRIVTIRDGLVHSDERGGRP